MSVSRRRRGGAPWIAFHTLSGLAGIGTSVTPRPDRASTMALITAGAAPIVPASPMPLTPSGFVGDGVTVWSERDRRHVARRRHEVVGERRRLQVAVRVVHGLLEQRLGEALDHAAVDLALDDQRVDLHAAVVDGDVALHVDAPVSVSTSTTHMCVPNGHEKFGGS